MLDFDLSLLTVSLLFLLANLGMFSWQWQRSKRASPAVQALSSFWLCHVAYIPLVKSKGWAQGEVVGYIPPLQWKELWSYMAKAVDMEGQIMKNWGFKLLQVMNVGECEIEGGSLWLFFAKNKVHVILTLLHCFEKSGCPQFLYLWAGINDICITG